MGYMQKLKDWYTGSDELEDPSKRETLGKLAKGGLELMLVGGIVGLAKRAGAEDVPEIVKMYPWDHVALSRKDLFDGRKFTYYHKKEDWKNLYQSEERCRNIFENPEIMDKVMNILTDNDLNNDELKGVAVSKNDVLGFWISSNKNGFKTKKGNLMYNCYLNLKPSDAEYLRRA